jgi:hypothetical protein
MRPVKALRAGLAVLVGLLVDDWFAFLGVTAALVLVAVASMALGATNLLGWLLVALLAAALFGSLYRIARRLPADGAVRVRSGSRRADLGS